MASPYGVWAQLRNIESNSWALDGDGSVRANA